MLEMYFLSESLFMIWTYSVLAVRGQGLGPPSFQSEWLHIRAQDYTKAFIEVHHGLGRVPDLVDILVRSTSEPNRDFIFKGIGNGERDDDARDPYGGITYTYNENSVRLYAPNRYNHYSAGAAIYTGEGPYWAGINTQKSLEASVKVRCWLSYSIGPTCFHVADLQMVAGSSDPEDTFKEINHNLSSAPLHVNVRAKMTDGPDAGWYIDGQGSNMYWLGTMVSIFKSGGLVYGYNNQTVRIWTSSYPYPNGVLFAREDGWGVVQILDVARRGLVEVSAWCDFLTPIVVETNVTLGPGVTEEQLEVHFPDLRNSVEDFFVSVQVLPREGPNQGYMFSGTGAAMTNTYNKGLPCAYGGLVYAYSATSVRFWRPAHSTGAALCIASKMGHGLYTQAQQSVLVLIRLWRFLILNGNIYKEPRFFTNHFSLIANNTRLLFPASASLGSFNSTDIGNCSWACSNVSECFSFATRPGECELYSVRLNETNTYQYVADNETQVWALVERYENDKDDFPEEILAKCWRQKENATSAKNLQEICFRP